MIEDVTAALCTAIQLRDRTTEPHDNVILEAIRDALSSQAQSSSQLAESVSNGIHDTILGALSAIREGSQRQADQASALQERAFEQLQAMPQMLRLFEERLNSERTLAMQMSAQMERIAENHASTLAELTSDNHRRQVAFIEAFKNQTEGFARLAQGTSDHQTVLVDRIETTHQQLHAASQSVLQLLVNQLSTSSTEHSNALQLLCQQVSANQSGCDIEQLAAVLQSQQQNFQQVFLASQENLLRQAQASSSENVAAILSPIDALQRLLYPAVEYALAIEKRPITIHLDGPSIEEISTSSQRTSIRTRREPSDVRVRFASPSAAHASATPGRASSEDAPDRTTARKAARSESAAPVHVSSSSTPFDVRDGSQPASRCSRCHSECSVLVREVHPSVPHRGDESEMANPATRLLLCDRCVSVRSDAEELSRASSSRPRDPSPEPRPPTL